MDGGKYSASCNDLCMICFSTKKNKTLHVYSIKAEEHLYKHTDFLTRLYLCYVNI